MYLGLWTAVYDGPIPVLGPANKTNTADIADQIHRFGIVESGMYPPALVEDLVRNPDYLSRLTKFKFITAGGAPLSKDAGDKLYPFGGLHLGIGSTEGAMWPVYKLEDRKDWQYFEFHEALCARFDHHTDDCYEMVIQRKPLSEEYTVSKTVVKQNLLGILLYPKMLLTLLPSDLLRSHARSEGGVPDEGSVEPASNETWIVEV